MKPLGTLLKILTLLVILFISACNLRTSSRPPLTVELTEPISGNTYILGTEITLSSISDTHDGSTNPTYRFLFYANGDIIGDSPASRDGGLMAATVNWRPEASGIYQLQSEALLNDVSDDRGGISSEVKVCVLDIPTEHIKENFFLEDVNFYINGYGGACPLPPPNPTDPNDHSFNMQVEPQSSFFAFPTNACPEVGNPVINFTATVNDPSDSLALIIIDITWGENFADRPLALSPSGVGPGNEKIFSGSWSPPNYYNGSTPITWTAFAYGRDGALLGTVTGTITMSPCVPEAGKPEVEATFTPSSAKDCPAGTYFAEVTFQCIPIAIVPTREGSEGGEVNSCVDPGTCPFGWSPQNCSCK